MKEIAGSRESKQVAGITARTSDFSNKPNDQLSSPRRSSITAGGGIVMKALSEDNVGIIITPIPSKWRWHYRRLCRLQTELLAHRATLLEDSKEISERPGKEPAHSGSEEFDRELILAELSRQQDALYEVEAALKRLEAGTYGICELTGKPIPTARLRALPAARFNCDAERKLERNGSISLTKLGLRRSLHDVLLRKKDL
jgi:RNA polymerase-binding transcription factor DksA